MRQRLGLAATLIRAPRLVFLDEPTNALDPRGARDVRSVARDLAANGAAVVLSSHDMAEVEELCATLTVIDRGRVIYAGTVDELRMRAPAAVHVLHTSDDERARELALALAVRARPLPDGGFEVAAAPEAVDAFVIALGCAGVAVRTLERRVRSLESLFLELTGHADTGESAVAVAADARKRQPAATVS